MVPRIYGNGPFENVSWSPAKKKAVEIFDQWHNHLRQHCEFSSAEQAKAGFQGLKLKLQNNEAQNIVPDALLDKIKEISGAYDLPIEWFYNQLDAAHYFYGEIQFKDARELKAFIAKWEAPHAYLIAKLADAAYTWQRKHLDELTMAFFIVDSLLQLPEDISKGNVYIPASEMAQVNVSLEQLKRGEHTEPVERLLWKQTIRARDAFAQGQPLIKELERKYRGTVRKNWLTGLEYINEIEKRRYDVWSEPLALSSVQRFQIFVLALIGRGARQARG